MLVHSFLLRLLLIVNEDSPLTWKRVGDVRGNVRNRFVRCVDIIEFIEIKIRKALDNNCCFIVKLFLNYLKESNRSRS